MKRRTCCSGTYIANYSTRGAKVDDSVRISMRERMLTIRRKGDHQETRSQIFNQIRSPLITITHHDVASQTIWHHE